MTVTTMTTKMLQHFLLALLVTVAPTTLVQGQDVSGFISIDCGLTGENSYVDTETGLTYISDTEFTESGESMNIASEYTASFETRKYLNVRSFPEGDRNCYKVGIRRGTTYLIRATFVYGNYDGQNQLPEFDMHIGPNKWTTVQPVNVSTITLREIIHVAALNYTDICLVNMGFGTPFISALEFRPLNNASYKTESGSLLLFARLDVGSSTNGTVRYPFDVFDRVWNPYHFNRWAELSTTETIDSQNQNNYRPPSIVMSTAGTPANANEPLVITITTENTGLEFYVYLHFAEIVRLQANQTREFNVYFNGKFITGPVAPDYLYTSTSYTISPFKGAQYSFSINKTENSTLAPILNAIELYTVIDLPQSQTDQNDANAITNIKSTYGLQRNWQGDPCAPQAYLWNGLNCSYNRIPRITSLNLSSSGLTGDITAHISGLGSLQSLDLSNNNLTGSVPTFLSQLSSLAFLNLAGNRLTGSVPPELIERSQQNLLTLRVDGNQNICASLSCNTKKKSVVVPIVASIAAVLVVMAALAIVLALRRRKQRGLPATETTEAKTNKTYEYLEPKKRQFAYSEVLDMTNNFERVLGEGGFGTVYHGYLNDCQVAVKMLSPSSVQGYKQFQAEVELLLRVHHRNLTSLVGFCDEGNILGLIYEYMASGNLEEHLSDRNTDTPSWNRRLQIVVEAAQGLEYLHNGCKPPIVHRDVKTTNILLNDQFHAKLADFGLSRAFPVEGGTHVSTVVVGTPGYLDPEYYEANRLTEKSDVYSFGVVILNVITGRPVISITNNERTHISRWVGSMLVNGDIMTIVDPMLGGDFDINSIWKAVEIAMACMSPTSAERPSMLQVVTELNECLAMETARKNSGHEFDSKSSFEVMTESTPLAR